MQNEELEQLQTIKIASPAVYVNSSLEAGLAVRGQSHTVGYYTLHVQLPPTTIQPQ